LSNLKLSEPDILKAWDLAWKEWRLGRVMAVKAYFGEVEGLHFDACSMCDEVGFLQPSGLKGWTCTRCEQEYNEAHK
jgi:hypothetical protein